MIDEVHARITLYNVIAGVIKDKPRSRQARVLSIVDEISRLQSEKAILEALLSQRFATPIGQVMPIFQSRLSERLTPSPKSLIMSLVQMNSAKC